MTPARSIARCSDSDRAELQSVRMDPDSRLDGKGTPVYRRVMVRSRSCVAENVEVCEVELDFQGMTRISKSEGI